MRKDQQQNEVVFQGFLKDAWGSVTGAVEQAFDYVDDTVLQTIKDVVSSLGDVVKQAPELLKEVVKDPELFANTATSIFGKGGGQVQSAPYEGTNVAFEDGKTKTAGFGGGDNTMLYVAGAGLLLFVVMQEK